MTLTIVTDKNHLSILLNALTDKKFDNLGLLGQSDFDVMFDCKLF